MQFLIRTSDSFDPSAILEDVGGKIERLDDLLWSLESDHYLAGLSILQKTSESEIVSLSALHPVDRDGWADWHQSGPDEYEVDTKVLPNNQAVPPGATAYRYEDTYYWDPSAPSTDKDILRRYGLLDITESKNVQKNGLGAYVYRAVKLLWTKTPKDVRIQAAIWLAEKAGRVAWEHLKVQSIEHRAVWEQKEWERRVMLQLAIERRTRLETGSLQSRRKAREYYTTLDYLMAINK